MRTLTVTHYGTPDTLEVVDLPTPPPGAGEVLIAVRAAAVNPVDVGMAAGDFTAMIGEPFPFGLGWDLAGTVAAIGDDVDGFAVGDAVVGLRDAFLGRSGTHASHVVLPAAALAPAPVGIDPIAAATFGLNTLTADQALDLLDLPAGSNLVVTGAAGGVGDYTVSLATHRGLRVIAVAGAADENDVRAAGATEFIARDVDLGAAVRALVPAGADGVFDAAVIGVPALAAVRDGGVFVAVSDPNEPPVERGIRVATVHVHADGVALTRLSAEVAAGRLRLRLAGTFPLSDAPAAYALAAEGGLRGRVVITV